MSIGPRLDLRQTTGLVMTPQLQQAIKILQLSNLELSAWLASEIAENPFLEQPEAENTSATDETTGANAPIAAPAIRVSPAAEELSDELNISRPETLREHVIAQIQMDIPDPVQRLLAMTLLDHLDEAGWLRADFGMLEKQLGCDAAELEAVLQMLQQMDPPGLFARTLAECLRLQLQDRGRLDPPMEKLLENLPLVARHDMPALARACDVSEVAITEMIAELRQLDPKPAQQFQHEPGVVLPPDILLRTNAEGQYFLELNPETLPRVLVNDRYAMAVQAGSTDQADKKYFTEKLNAANWLMKAMQQRAETILQVAGEIVRLQDGFLRRGISQLKPLTLKQVADAIGMHESTVSRVTNGKTIATPRGVLELKFFFTNAIAGTDGNQHSSAAVREALRQILSRETSANPFTDDQLVAMLAGQGMQLARRTVAKYRDMLGVAPVHERRRRPRPSDRTSD